MKKKLSVIIMTALLIMTLAACGGDEITLKFSFGEKTGTYEGEMKDGVPHGQGTFTSENSEGEKWTYEGEFKNGHFDGQGSTTWENGTCEIGIYKDDVIQPMTAKELNKVYGNPDQYKNHYVEVTGRVFGSPDYDDGMMAVQMWGDPENSEKNTIAYIWDEDFDVHEDDYIRVRGTVDGEFSGENMLGGEVSALVINSYEWETISYMEAVAPTKKTIEVDKTIKQYGYSVKIDKVELAENETRVYVEVANNGSDEFDMYSFNSKIIQNKHQYKEEDNWEADYPELDSEISVGTESAGVFVFPAIEDADFKIKLEGSSYNWEEDIKPFIFNIKA